MVEHPIWQILKFQGRSLKWLATKTGYSYSHVKGIANGFQAASPVFRAKCADLMDLPETVLFAQVAQEARSAVAV